tara:strand:+ start:8097 stop:8822 length:726 start_codon:yes stop_codon:yes gene_type:complete
MARRPEQPTVQFKGSGGTRVPFSVIPTPSGINTLQAAMAQNYKNQLDKEAQAKATLQFVQGQVDRQERNRRAAEKEVRDIETYLIGKETARKAAVTGELKVYQTQEPTFKEFYNDDKDDSLFNSLVNTLPEESIAKSLIEDLDDDDKPAVARAAYSYARQQSEIDVENEKKPAPFESYVIDFLELAKSKEVLTPRKSTGLGGMIAGFFNTDSSFTGVDTRALNNLRSLNTDFQNITVKKIK